MSMMTDEQAARLILAAAFGDANGCITEAQAKRLLDWASTVMFQFTMLNLVWKEKVLIVMPKRGVNLSYKKVPADVEPDYLDKIQKAISERQDAPQASQ